MTNYGIIVGSIRKNSYSKGVADAIVAGLPDDAIVTYINIAQLPLYNQDYDVNYPVSYVAFKKTVAKQDAFIFVTPEHNHNVPSALSNAIDIGSRPWGQNAWDNKPALIASQSIAGLSGTLANHILRQMLVTVNMPTMQQPELYIGNTLHLSDETGNITNEDTKLFLTDAGKKYDQYVQKFIEK